MWNDIQRDSGSEQFPFVGCLGVVPGIHRWSHGNQKGAASSFSQCCASTLNCRQSIWGQQDYTVSWISVVMSPLNLIISFHIMNKAETPRKKKCWILLISCLFRMIVASVLLIQSFGLPECLDLWLPWILGASYRTQQPTVPQCRGHCLTNAVQHCKMSSTLFFTALLLQWIYYLFIDLLLFIYSHLLFS